MNSHLPQSPNNHLRVQRAAELAKPPARGRGRSATLLGALLVLFGATQVACVVETRPVYVVEQPPPPETVVVEEGADTTVVVDDFYEPLGYYGVWVYIPGYGRCWQPAADVAGPGFTPYMSHGHWVLNADGDWVFVSRYDAQWGWATYHYGRWMWTDYYGWVWVPGRAWAPAWVDWRYGGGYVGWVPMGPPGYVVVEEHWVFVERTYIGAEAVESYRLPPERARTAYVAANPIIDVKGDSKWKQGPPPHEFKAAGIEVGTVAVAKPAAGYIKTQAQVSVAGAAERKASGKIVTEPYVRPGTTVAPGAGVARPGPNPAPPPGQQQLGPQPGIQPGQPNNPGMQPQPGIQPGQPNNPGMQPQPGIQPQPRPQPQPLQPMPQPTPQPTVQPRPMPQPQPTPQPSMQPRPTPQPTAQPRPAPRPSTPAPRPSPPKRRK